MSNLEITNGSVIYTGFNPDDNNKIWIEEKRDGKYTYVCCQANEFSRPYVCIVSVTKDMLPDYEKYLLEFPKWAKDRVMSGETGYTYWQGETHWFFDKDEAIEAIKSSLRKSYALT
nr:hypothetical protein [uncultured Butyrivibrio sp.]